jgi:ADP-ribose pyrophosphatase YjhB (NUDIX family)
MRLPVYQGKVILVHREPHAPRAWFLELPRGFGIEGISTAECVRQELAEAIGQPHHASCPLARRAPI